MPRRFASARQRARERASEGRTGRGPRQLLARPCATECRLCHSRPSQSCSGGRTRRREACGASKLAGKAVQWCRRHRQRKPPGARQVGCRDLRINLVAEVLQVAVGLFRGVPACASAQASARARAQGVCVLGGGPWCPKRRCARHRWRGEVLACREPCAPRSTRRRLHGKSREDAVSSS